MTTTPRLLRDGLDTLGGGTNQLGTEGKNEYPQTVEDLKDYDFFILNKKDHVSIAINFISDNEYRGISFTEHNTGWSLNPIKIGKGWITNSPELDFTKSYDEAFKNAKL